MKIKFKNIRKGLEDLHTDDDLTNEDFIDEQSSELLNTEFVPPFIIDKQSSELLNLEIETYYTEPNGTTFTYDPKARTFSVNDVTTGMSTEFAVPPFIVEKPEVIEYGDAAIDFSSLSNEEQYRINLLLRQKNFVHYDFYKRLSALKSSMTEEQFKQYEDANKYLSIDDYGVLDLSNEPYSVLTAVLDSLEEAGYKLEEREEPIVKTKENPHNLSLREIDWMYAELNFPAGVTHPDEYHDLSVTNDYYNLHPHKITMTLSDYDKTKAVEDAIFNTSMDLATLLIPLKIGGFKGAWKGLKFLGKSLLDPGSFVDWVGKTTKYATPLARSWFGASTIPGIATNLGMSGYFGYDAYKGLRENGLNWQTGLETGFAALPFVAEGAPYIVKGITKGIKRVNKSIKYLDTDRNNELIHYLELKNSASKDEYRHLHPIKEEELDEVISKFLNSNVSDADKQQLLELNEKRKELESLIEDVENEYNAVISKINNDLATWEFEQKIEKLEKRKKELSDQYDALISSLSKKLNLPDIPDRTLVLRMNIFKDLTDLEQVLKSLGIIDDSVELIISGDAVYVKTKDGIKPFTLVQDEKIPILDASGKQIGELPVITNLESGKAIISDGYIETTTNNIKALQAKFPGAKPFGSSVMVSDLQVPHFTHDYDFIIAEEDAAKIAGLDKVLFNSNGFTKTVGIDANGNIVPADHGIFNVDLNIIRSDPDGKVIHDRLTEELFRHFDPELNSELTALSFVKDSKKHKVDIPMTPKELLDGYDPVVNTFLDAHEINYDVKQKHRQRILGYIIYSRNPKKIEECITQLARAQNLTGDWRAPRSIFNNVEENKQFLRSIGFSEEDIANIATNPEVMQNLFDYWTLDKIVRRRGIYNGITNFNDPNLSLEEKTEMLLNAFREWKGLGGSAHGPGLNTVNGTSDVTFDIMGTFSLKPDLSECKTLTEAVDKILYTVGAEEYGGAFPEILQGMTPSLFLSSHSMNVSLWKPVSKTLSDAGVLALTYPQSDNYLNDWGTYSTVVDDPNRSIIFSFLNFPIRPMDRRFAKLNFSRILATKPYLVTNDYKPNFEGSVYPNVVKRLQEMIKEQSDVEKKISINKGINKVNLQILENQHFRSSSFGNTKHEVDNYLQLLKTDLNLKKAEILDCYYSMMHQNEIDKLNKKINKLISLNNVSTGIKNTLQVAMYTSIVATLLLAINKVFKSKNSLKLNDRDRRIIESDLNFLNKDINKLTKELEKDEKHRDYPAIRLLEKNIHQRYNIIDNFINKNNKSYLFKQHIQELMPEFELERELYDTHDNKTPKDKQGGKLIPRNKFLSIYSLI